MVRGSLFVKYKGCGWIQMLETWGLCVFRQYLEGFILMLMKIYGNIYI